MVKFFHEPSCMNECVVMEYILVYGGQILALIAIILVIIIIIQVLNLLRKRYI